MDPGERSAVLACCGYHVLAPALTDKQQFSQSATETVAAVVHTGHSLESQLDLELP